MSKLLYKELTDKIIKAAIEVHKILGPGLLESAYEECLVYELIKMDLSIKQQLMIPIKYKDIKLKTKYRLDLLVENKVITELKSVEKLTLVHEAQLITYLKLSGYRIGFLINFNVTLIKNGIKRKVNKI